jgi:hypothetical protein
MTMTEPLNAAPVAANAPGLPEKQRRLIELDDAIAKIRTQIATADLTRQTQGKPIDPVWFNRARTAQRHLYRERAELLADGSGWHRRNKVKDALIDILRARHDPEIWTELLAEARARSEAEDL